MKQLLLPVALLFTSTLAVAQDPEFDYKLLSERRASLALPSYTSEQKLNVLNQARVVLTQLFVHDQLKLQDFGESANPTPALDALEAEIKTVTDVEFHGRMRDMVNRLKDLHTTYRFPLPYGCYANLLPFNFKEVIRADGEKAIAVATMATDEGLTRLVPNLVVQVGDELVTYNGLEAYDAAHALEPRALGANPAAQLRREIGLLSVKGQKRDFAPEQDFVDLTLRNSRGEIYQTRVPWISSGDLECLNPPTDMKKKGPAKKVVKLDVGMDDEQFLQNRLFRSHIVAKSKDEFKDSADPILKFKRITNQHGEFGVLKLESFVPEKLSVDEVISEVARILKTEFKATQGVIFDVRNNGGGYIALAEKMVQLFTPRTVQPLGFRLKNSSMNQTYWDKWPNNRFTQALKLAQAQRAHYTEPLSLNFVGDVNKLDQAYFGPVAVLMNSNCYSSCDMFSAIMQDHEVGTIFGEDANTGAGGANNISIKDIFNGLDEERRGVFSTPLPSGQDIGFSWRQTVRSFGARRGDLIENVGVVADEVVPASSTDLISDDDEQFATISERLIEATTERRSSVAFETSSADVPMGAALQIKARWTHTTSIEFRKDGVLLGTINVDEDAPQMTTITLPFIAPSVAASGRIEALGLVDGEPVWRKFYQYRTVPASIVIAGRLFSDFSRGSEAYFINYGSSAVDGWQVRDGALRVGAGPQYSNNLTAHASLFVTLPTNSAMTMTANLEGATEKGYDYFRMIIIAAGEETEVFANTSGPIPAIAHNIDLASFAGQSIEIRLEFNSDEAEGEVGPALDQFIIW
jgi:C-terminal processing protease CtpA/Prc